jgi:hypothetical protein
MDGVLMTHGGNGDLVSDKEYGDYILEFEFKCAPKGNSGVIYKVLEDVNNKELFAPYAAGPEFQIIDDVNYPDKIKDVQKTGANYDIQAPLDLKAVKPAGEWNKGKLVIKNNVIEHFVNGIKTASYEYGSVKWAMRHLVSWLFCFLDVLCKFCTHVLFNMHNKDIFFKEIQRFTQWWIWLPLLTFFFIQWFIFY